MNAIEKMDQLLKAAIDKISGADPDFPLDVTVIPESSASPSALRRYIEGQGGEVTAMNSNVVYSRMPIGQIRRLADSDLVSAVRLTRIHRMHK